MSINGALLSAVSGLKAQSTAMSIISDNLANSDTTGYKASTTSFSTLVTGTLSNNAYSSGGVRATPRQNVNGQGLIESTSTSTDLALDGNGMFVVTDGADGEVLYYTRNGEFDVDSYGYLTNGTYVLQGWALDQDGNIVAANTNSANSLEAINLNTFNSTAAATDEVSIQANLPANASISVSGSNTFTSSMEIYDSLGTAHTISITWAKTAENTWTADFDDPTLVSDDGTTTGTVSGGPITVSFDSDGLLSGTSPSPATISVTGWTTGAADSTISLDLGTVGKTDGLTQYAPDADADIDIEVNDVNQNGLRYGEMESVEISSDGTVIANYDNGDEVAIYKIAVATFANYNGLELNTGGVYKETSTSGNYNLTQAGSSGAGEITSYALESSSTDTADEFSRMIVCQQAYSAAAQMITTCDEMYDTLISSVR